MIAMALSLLHHRIRPTPGAHKARPLSSEEIDAHPDADRIWATIVALREDISRQRDRDHPSSMEPGL